MLLDGSQYETFVIDCKTSVDSLRVKNVSPGKLYVFVLVQDAAGNHRFSWGDRLRNAAPIDLDPEAITVQSFIGLTGGVLQSVPPGTWVRTGEGNQGPPGPPGPPGLSAYQLAVQEGFQGTLQQWLDSLQGADGISPQIIQVADEATAITQSQANPNNLYFWM